MKGHNPLLQISILPLSMSQQDSPQTHVATTSTPSPHCAHKDIARSIHDFASETVAIKHDESPAEA